MVGWSGHKDSAGDLARQACPTGRRFPKESCHVRLLPVALCRCLSRGAELVSGLLFLSLFVAGGFLVGLLLRGAVPLPPQRLR